jgi:DNA-binding GntR family transcriptional regulator
MDRDPAQIHDESDMSMVPHIEQELVSHQAYHIIRDLVADRVLRQGARINVNELAERMGVSPTPVKEALSRLAEEGLVEVIPRKGTFVTQLSVEDLAEILDVRRGLELLAAESAVENITPDEIAEMRKLALALQNPPSRMKYHLSFHVRKNQDLHNILVQASRNKKLISIYSGLHVAVLMARAIAFGRWESRVKADFFEHQAIINSLETGCREKLIKAVDAHLLRGRESVLQDFARELEHEAPA